MIFRAVCVVFLVFQMCITEITACTGVLLKTKDESFVNGRTVEFGTAIDMSVAIIPRNYKFVGEIPNGAGMPYKSKYAAAGIYCFTDKKLMDGINEKGLVAAAFYFPGYAKYARITKANQPKALSPVEFPNWILTQFATIEEVKDAISSVVIAPSVMKGWGDAPPPMHYIVYDKEGHSIVIEPLDGKLVVYENVLGAITNSPSFDWHLQNLSNYINLSPLNVGPIDLRGLKLSSFGQGSGLGGLPGDFTPPSRFVRAAIFSAASVPSVNSDEAVNQTFHVLNQFDIPIGVIRQKDGEKIEYDSTLLTSVKDPNTLKYYYRSYEDQTVKFIDLKKFDRNAKVIKDMKIVGKQKNLDVSSLLK